MNYQIVINLTHFTDTFSIDKINTIIKKKINNEFLSIGQQKNLQKILCYTLLILVDNNIDNNIDLLFLGKKIFIQNVEDIEKNISVYKLNLVSLEHIYSDNNYVSFKMMGGLCNRLFQLLAIYSYANINNKKIYIDINTIEHNPHSSIDYDNTLFKKFQKIKISMTNGNAYIHNEKNNFQFEQLPVSDKNTFFIGYFQHQKYLSNIITEFYNIICFTQNTKEILSKSIFIHIRLGDYVNNSFHDIGLLKGNYYSNALNHYNNIELNKIYILSNDINKTKELNIFNNECLKSKIEYVDLNELDSLLLMASCEYGGICANSSFSWFGAYLNKNFNTCNNKKFIFPKKWTNTQMPCNIYFDGSIVID